MSKTPDEIWSDDLLDRREDATLLIGFIESLFDRAAIKERGHAYTISVDAPYGVGKSFFLRRLAEELSNSHPVAFVDAWVDDLADEPFVALVSTLKAALGPLIDDPKVGANWQKFIAKSGKVAGIVTLGLMKRGLGLLITAPAVDAASKVIETTSDEVQGAVAEGVAAMASGAIDDLASAIKNGPTGLKARIEEFEVGKGAIVEMKDSLRALVSSLSDSGLAPPIVIIVDELDRCRPSYAIKLFEEVKHLFDVPGVVFLFGVHAEQLTHSVKWAYGADFDGSAYLKRFVSRKYTLKTPSMKSLVNVLLSKSNIKGDDYVFPASWRHVDGSHGAVDLPFALDLYVDELSITARELFELFDVLEISTAIARPRKIILPYIMPIIAAHIRNMSVDAMSWGRVNRMSYSIRGGQSVLSPKQLFEEFHAMSRNTYAQISKLYNSSSDNYVIDTAFEAVSREADLSDFRRYEELLTAVRRFSD